MVNVYPFLDELGGRKRTERRRRKIFVQHLLIILSGIYLINDMMIDEYVLKLLEWKVGRRDKIKFWEDLLGREQFLASTQDYFLISFKKDEFIGNMGEWERDEGGWRLEWRTECSVWEREGAEWTKT